MTQLNEWIAASLTGAGVWLPLVAFLLCGGVVFLAASRLAHHADAIADATGLGRVWVGSLLLAGSTSLPEIVTDVNAAALGAVDIGVGDLFGSTLANMLILACLDIAYARRRILHQVALDHTLVGALAIVLTAIAGLSLANGGLPAIGPVGLDTTLIVAIYVFGMHAVYRGISVPASVPEQLALGDTGRTVLRRGLLGIGLGLLALVVTAPLLVTAAEAIATETGQSQTLIGTTLVGITTSFPEIAATIAAARLGAFDLAVGNIFGSNAFNMCVLFAMDLAYSGGTVLGSASSDHARSAEVGVLALALGVMGILARAQRRIAVVRVESLLIVGAYIGLLWLLAR